MPDSGETLGVDLHELWQAGTQYLPAVAEHLRSARRSVDVATGDDTAFRRPDAFGGGPHGPAYEAIARLGDALAEMLRHTADNLDEVSAVLLLAANEYAKTDAQAKDTFLSLLPHLGPVR